MSVRRLTNIAAGAGDLKALAATVQREFDNLYKGIQSVTVTGTLPIVATDNDVSIKQASASQDGYLSAADYARFSDAATSIILSGNVTSVERANWNSAYAHSTTIGNPHSTRLDQVLDPTAEKFFSFSDKNLGFTFADPQPHGSFDGAFEIEGTGSFQGDLLHIHQRVGSIASVNTDLVHMEVTSTNINPLRVAKGGSNYLLIDNAGVASFSVEVRATNALKTFIDASNYFVINYDATNWYAYGFNRHVYLGSATAAKSLVFVAGGTGVASYTSTAHSISVNTSIADTKTLGSATFVSGYFGGGWKNDYSAGQGYTLELDNLVVRNTLRAFIFQKDIVRASNGYLFISDVSEIVYAVGIAPGDTDYIYTKENVFLAGDILWYKDIDETTGLVITGIKCTVNSADGSVSLPAGGKTGYRYSVTTNGGSGGTYRVGGTIVRVGSSTTSRQGSIYFDSSSPNYAPFMDVYDGVASWTDFQSTAKVKLRAGKLTGITDYNFGTLQGYGIYTQNAYFTGNVQVYGTLAAGGVVPGSSFFAGKIATNLLTKPSDRFSSWSENAPSGLTVTDVSGISPEGIYAASQWDRSGGTNPYKYNATTTQCQTKTFTFSVWLAGDAGGEQVSLFIARWGDYVNIATQTFTLTTGWLRYSVTGTANGTNPTNVAYCVITQLTDNSTIYVWGAQLEEAPYAGVYQRTDGSATWSGTEKYGMWAVAGGFGGTMQAPVVQLGGYGLRINHAGIVTQALATQTIMLGEITGTAVSAIKLANTGTGSTSGLFGYDSSGTESFKLALDGTAKVGGWSFDNAALYNTNAKLHGSGYVSFGATPPTSYGNNVGVWLGYSSGAKLSLYSDANNYMQWDGSALAITGATFTSGIIRTAAANNTRIELNGSANALRFIKGNGSSDTDIVSISPSNLTFFASYNTVEFKTTTGTGFSSIGIGDFGSNYLTSASRLWLTQEFAVLRSYDSSGSAVQTEVYLGTDTSGSAASIRADGKRFLSGNETDKYVGGLSLSVAYSGAYTITRHNYINLIDVGLLSSAACTDAAVFRFSAGIGTHKALDYGTTKSNPGSVTGWVKINVNGTLHYIPCYSSKTS